MYTREDVLKVLAVIRNIPTVNSVFNYKRLMETGKVATDLDILDIALQTIGHNSVKDAAPIKSPIERRQFEGKDIYSTYEDMPDVKYIHRRMQGNSTRQVDAAIQMLFEGKAILCKDNWEMGTNTSANYYLFEKILKRLGLEHPQRYIVSNRTKLLIAIDTNAEHS